MASSRHRSQKSGSENGHNLFYRTTPDGIEFLGSVTPPWTIFNSQIIDCLYFRVFKLAQLFGLEAAHVS